MRARGRRIATDGGTAQERFAGVGSTNSVGGGGGWWGGGTATEAVAEGGGWDGSLVVLFASGRLWYLMHGPVAGVGDQHTDNVCR